VGLVETGVMAKVAPADLKAQIDAAKGQIIDGSITVKTAFGMSTDAIEAIRAAVRP
jgi:basic membrane protein A